MQARWGRVRADWTDSLAEADIVTLHCPLTPETRHLIDAEALAQVKPGVMLINTSRGALLDTPRGDRGAEGGRDRLPRAWTSTRRRPVFFEDLSGQTLQDDVLARLLTFPNVLVTGHQAFFTREALADIAETTLANVPRSRRGRSANEVECPSVCYGELSASARVTARLSGAFDGSLVGPRTAVRPSGRRRAVRRSAPDSYFLKFSRNRPASLRGRRVVGGLVGPGVARDAGSRAGRRGTRSDDVEAEDRIGVVGASASAPEWIASMIARV